METKENLKQTDLENSAINMDESNGSNPGTEQDEKNETPLEEVPTGTFNAKKGTAILVGFFFAIWLIMHCVNYYLKKSNEKMFMELMQNESVQKALDDIRHDY